MKRIFYKKLLKLLKCNGEAYVITIINGEYNEKSVIGEKLIKSKETIFIEHESISDFWDEILNKIDLNKGTHTSVLEDNTEVFVEYILDKPRLIICGGGHISLSLYKIAKMLDLDVTIIDNRIEFANEERFPDADLILCRDFDEALNEVRDGQNTYYVIVTRGHKDDRKCLEIILKKDFFYVGMIGSRGKINFVINNMLNNGYKKEDIEKVHAPIGLNIGAQTPEEIAVSILGEIIQVKNKKNSSNIETDILKAIDEENDLMALATIIEKKGSSPRGIGARMLVYENKKFIGTVGGGSVENATYEKALEVIKDKRTIIEEYNLSNSSSAKLGMACGGNVKVLFEFIEE